MRIQAIRAYYQDAIGEHHRYRSWEHCYRYFRHTKGKGPGDERDHAALQLGFYLASWGMYRGSSFLLQHAYTVHRGVIDVIADPRFDALWELDFGQSAKQVKVIPAIVDLVDSIRNAYKGVVPGLGGTQPTDTLLTKIALGTLGCLPACDRYFIAGLKCEGHTYSRLNRKFIEWVHGFCLANILELRQEQAKIEKVFGVRYPLMKLVDMYFWQIGYEQAYES